MTVLHWAALGLAVATTLAVASPAAAKSAYCYNSDDGYYNCNFEGIEGDGSFVIKARGYPTYTVYVDRPASASVYASYGSSRSVPLDGVFRRSHDDGACWVNRQLDFEICAW